MRKCSPSFGERKKKRLQTCIGHKDPYEISRDLERRRAGKRGEKVADSPEYALGINLLECEHKPIPVSH